MKKMIKRIAVGVLGAGLIFGAVNMMQGYSAEAAEQTPLMGGNGYMMQQQMKINEAVPPYHRHGLGMMNNYRDTRGYGWGMMHGYHHILGYSVGMMYGSGPFHEDLANFLGMTEKELYDARLAGKTLFEIAAEADITEETLVEEITALHNARWDYYPNRHRMNHHYQYNMPRNGQEQQNDSIKRGHPHMGGHHMGPGGGHYGK